VAFVGAGLRVARQSHISPVRSLNVKSLFRLLHHSFVPTPDLLFMNGVDLMDQSEI